MNTLLNKTVLLRDRKRRTARTPTSKSFQNVQNFVHFLSKTLSIFCPKFCQTFVSKFIGGGTPGAPPQLGGTPGHPPPVGGYPGGAPPVGGYPWGLPPSWRGTPRPPPVGGTPRGAPQFRGCPKGRPPSWGVPPGAPRPVWGVPLGAPPCEQTNWKHYLPVILRMRAVIKLRVLLPLGFYWHVVQIVIKTWFIYN